MKQKMRCSDDRLRRYYRLRDEMDRRYGAFPKKFF